MIPSRRFVSYRLTGFGLFAALVVLSAVSNASTRVFTWPWALYAGLLLLAPVFLLGWEQLRAPVRPRPGGWAFAAAAAVLGLSALLSRQPAFSLGATLPLWSGLAWVWFLTGFIDETGDEPGRFLFFARAAGFALFCPLLTGLVLWILDLREAAGAGGWAGVLSNLSSFRNPHPLGHSNYTGGFALLAVPWLGALAWLDRSRWRPLWIVAGAVGLIVFFSASSRGAVVGALAMLVLALGGALAAGRITLRRALLPAAFGLLVGFALFVSNPRLRALAADPSSLFRPNEGDVQRIAMLQGGTLLGWQRPWIGHGAGLTPFVYPEVRAQLVGGVETSYQLHNGWLQLWVNSGFAGLAVAAWLLLLVGCAVRRWWRAPVDDRRTFALVSAVTLGGYAVVALADYQLDVIALVAALGFHTAIVLATPGLAEAPAARRWAGGLILLGGLASFAVLGPEWRGRALFWDAWNGPSDRPATIARLRAAIAAVPRDTHYQNHLGFQLALEAEAANNARERQEAREVLDGSLRLDPAQEPVHAALGWLWLYENPRESRQHFEAALRLLPDRDTTHLGLALASLSVGDRPRAARALAVECLVDPIFLSSPLWTQPPLAPLHDEVIASLPACLDEALRHPALPAWRRSGLIYFQAFFRWWRGGRAPDAVELTGAGNAARVFFVTLEQSARGAVPPELWPPPWNRLAAAAATPARAAEILRAAPAPTASAVDGALARLRAPAGDLGALLRQPVGQGAGVVKTGIERSHFMFMHRNLDGPGYPDFAPRFYDEFVTHFAGPLFPPRGLLPGPVIVQLDRGLPLPSAP